MADNGREVAEPNDATPFLPERRSLKTLREAAVGCRGCHLWRHATHTVFGDGLHWGGRKWLLVKKRDETAARGRDLPAESVVSGRRIEELV